MRARNMYLQVPPFQRFPGGDFGDRSLNEEFSRQDNLSF